jgi:predicted Zn-ribbon and HTH transcriptional regulator
MVNSTGESETREGQALREMVVVSQAKLTDGWVTFPINAICRCGYDFTDDPTSLKEIKSGCPLCHVSYCS